MQIKKEVAEDPRLATMRLSGQIYMSYTNREGGRNRSKVDHDEATRQSMLEVYKSGERKDLIRPLDKHARGR